MLAPRIPDTRRGECKGKDPAVRRKHKNNRRLQVSFQEQAIPVDDLLQPSYFLQKPSFGINCLCRNLYILQRLFEYSVCPSGAVASMLGMLFAPKLKRKLDSKQLFILATVFHSVALAIVFIVGYEVHWIITSLLMFFAMLPWVYSM